MTKRELELKVQVLEKEIEILKLRLEALSKSQVAPVNPFRETSVPNLHWYTQLNTIKPIPQFEDLPNLPPKIYC